MAAVASPNPNSEAPRTIVHEIMESKLPLSEKRFDRVFEEVSTVTGAGFETTASALRLILFHLFSTPKMLERLRAELASASAISPNLLDLKALEQLPYLTAILMEGLRLSPAIATRMARMAPDTGLIYNQWHIPPGTPVGMTLILMHTDEALYPEPRRFDPNRWMHPDARKNLDKTFAPFSRGTRNCLGMQYVSLCLHTPAQSFLDILLTKHLVLHGLKCIFLSLPLLSNLIFDMKTPRRKTLSASVTSSPLGPKAGAF